MEVDETLKMLHGISEDLKPINSPELEMEVLDFFKKITMKFDRARFISYSDIDLNIEPINLKLITSVMFFTIVGLCVEAGVVLAKDGETVCVFMNKGYKRVLAPLSEIIDFDEENFEFVLNNPYQLQ